MIGAPDPASLPEPRRNELLRSVDWRFLLRQSGRPRALDLTSGRLSEALALISDAAGQRPGEADLVVLGFPTRRRLRRARAALRPGGEVVCLWRLPRIAGVQRARARLDRAGLEVAGFHWPGPGLLAPAEFWLPLGAPRAIEHVLSQRAVPSKLNLVMRRLWRLAERIGALAPVCVTARKTGSHAADDEIARILPAPEPWVLLSTGSESTNKVVGLPFSGGESAPKVVLKVARTPDSDPAIERESAALAALTERPNLRGVPTLRATGQRCGRKANVQSAIYGDELTRLLTRQNFAGLASLVTDWLIELANVSESSPPINPADLTLPLVEEFALHFASHLAPDTIKGARHLLSELDQLPAVVEHGDMAPWNVLKTAGGLGVIDWETANTRGLPGRDLAFFLATSAVLVEKPTSNPAAGLHPTIACQRRLLDPATEIGAVAATCVERYCDRVEIEADAFARLRLLSWILQAVEYHGLESEALNRADPTWFHSWAFAGAAEDEVRRLTNRQRGTPSR